jgi:hypothetical protein
MIISVTRNVVLIVIAQLKCWVVIGLTNGQPGARKGNRDIAKDKGLEKHKIGASDEIIKW